MISVERARQQANDLIESGNPNRQVMVMLTQFHLAVLNVHLATYVDVLGKAKTHQQTLKDLDDIGDRIQKVVTQILQSEFPST